MPRDDERDSPVVRAARWRYVIESLVGGLDDEGVLAWLNLHGPDLDRLQNAADIVRDGGFQ